VIVYDANSDPPCAQGDDTWFALHCGIPSAGGFDRIMTPKTRKLSASSIDYRNRLLADWLLGSRPDDVVSAWMARGKDLEARARAAYEWDHAAVQEVGFILRDDRMVGCSPDGLVGDDGLIEIKVLSAANHVGYLLGPGQEDYQTQVQGQLWLTDRQWCDRVTWHPEWPMVVRRVERNDEYIADLAAAVDGFIDSLLLCRDQLKAMGLRPNERNP